MENQDIQGEGGAQDLNFPFFPKLEWNIPF